VASSNAFMAFHVAFVDSYTYGQPGRLKRRAGALMTEATGSGITRPLWKQCAVVRNKNFHFLDCFVMYSVSRLVFAACAWFAHRTFTRATHYHCNALLA
jgi:hypothetical protein